jgi:predicted metal-dependent phosphoesterase TrpH
MRHGTLKLDLHTHCRSATASSKATLPVVRKIVAAVRAAGLDGIAVTEHYTDYFGHEVKGIVDSQLNGEIVVIPGKEIDMMVTGGDMGVIHVVELYLPDDLTFRFIAHPGYPYVGDLESHIDGSIHGLELQNPAHLHDVDQREVRRLARKHDLMLLSNSDAHSLGDIGTFYNEIDIGELSARARAAKPTA